MWSVVVELFEALVFVASQSLGGHLGFAIFTVSATTRLALMPLTYRWARRARRRQALTREMAPELARLREKWSSDPRKLARATVALYESRGLRPVDPGVLAQALVQSPPAIALFQAVRRVVSGTPLAQGSLPVTLLAGFLSFTAMAASTPPSGPQRTLWVAGLVGAAAAVMAFVMGSGFGLYSAAYQGVATVQAVMIRRAERREA